MLYENLCLSYVHTCSTSWSTGVVGYPIGFDYSFILSLARQMGLTLQRYVGHMLMCIAEHIHIIGIRLYQVQEGPIQTPKRKQQLVFDLLSGHSVSHAHPWSSIWKWWTLVSRSLAPYRLSSDWLLATCRDCWLIPHALRPYASQMDLRNETQLN